MFAMELEGNSISSSTTQKQRVESAASELDSGSLPIVRSHFNINSYFGLKITIILI